ncbi:Hypothetical predicted protein [Podarcis lilfordi]|uniref:Uncharacterized protein n=1 Tax=Podarcis lilfordi TaxID=74358 RepID=A0AA35NZM3_9SAUR|nr:Hypothetical predicted protein [Podarcis lilfordi]
MLELVSTPIPAHNAPESEREEDGKYLRGGEPCCNLKLATFPPVRAVASAPIPMLGEASEGTDGQARGDAAKYIP